MLKPPTLLTVLDRLNKVITEFKDYLEESVRTSEGIIDYELALEEGLKFHTQEFIIAEETKHQLHRDQLDQAKEFYKEYLPSSIDRFPPKYMKKNPEIMKMFRRTRFVDVIRYLLRITSNLESTRELQKFISDKNYRISETILTGKNAGKTESRELILLSIDYSDITTKLEMSKNAVKGYLSELVRIGILRIIGGGRGTKINTIYAIGTWVPTKPKFSRKLFFKDDEEWRGKLISFTPFKDERVKDRA